MIWTFWPGIGIGLLIGAVFGLTVGGLAVWLVYKAHPHDQGEEVS